MLILSEFLAYFRSVKARSVRTCTEYEKCILHMLDYMRQHRHDVDDDFSFLQSITKKDMIAYITHCDIELKNSPEARCTKISAARAFWQYMVAFDYLDSNVMQSVPRPRRQVKPIRYLSLVDSILLLKSAESHQNDFYRFRNVCILTLFLNCAFRLSELTGIKLQDIDCDTITVLGKGNRLRSVIINPAVKEALFRYLSVRPNSKTDQLFVCINGQPLSVNSIAQQVKKNIKLAGLNINQLSTHKLRHTSATLMYKYGHVDIRVLQEILGHSTIATTERYTHTDSIQTRNAVYSNPLSSMVF